MLDIELNCNIIYAVRVRTWKIKNAGRETAGKRLWKWKIAVECVMLK
jgi:hypothetical protein